MRNLNIYITHTREKEKQFQMRYEREGRQRKTNLLKKNERRKRIVGRNKETPKGNELMM